MDKIQLANPSHKYNSMEEIKIGTNRLQSVRIKTSIHSEN